MGHDVSKRINIVYVSCDSQEMFLVYLWINCLLRFIAYQHILRKQGFFVEVAVYISHCLVARTSDIKKVYLDLTV